MTLTSTHNYFPSIYCQSEGDEYGRRQFCARHGEAPKIQIRLNQCTDLVFPRPCLSSPCGADYNPHGWKHASLVYKKVQLQCRVLLRRDCTCRLVSPLLHRSGHLHMDHRSSPSGERFADPCKENNTVCGNIAKPITSCGSDYQLWIQLPVVDPITSCGSNYQL